MSKSPLLWLTALSLLLISCDNTLEINAEYRDLTIMYSALDPKKDTNWVRIERAYLGEAPANESFDEPDSLYYRDSEIQVLLREYQPEASKGNFEREIPLEVDFDRFSLEPGTFTTDSFRMYRTPSGLSLNPDLEYEVAVIRPDNSEAHARTNLVQDFDLNQPNPNFPIYQDEIQWDEAENASGYEVQIVFKYSEFNRDTEHLSQDSLRFTFRDLNRQSLQTNIVALIGSNPDIEVKDNVFRFFEEVRIEVWAVGEDLNTYMELNRPQSGINQNRPEFPQVTNGSGVISSRTKVSRGGIDLDRTRIFNNLINSNATCDLRFAEIRQQGSDTCICDGQGGLRCF